MAKGEKINVVTAALNAVKALMNLKAEDKPAAEKMLADFGVSMDIEKATRAQDLTDAEMVKDRWEDGNMHTAVTKEEVKVGPGESASGSGAEKMIRDYSNPTTQMGTTLLAEKLARLIPPMASSIKSLLAGMEKLAAQNAAQSEAIIALSKALEPDVAKAEDEDEDEDEKDFKEESEKSARKSLKAAKSLVRKAKAAKSDAEDEEDAKACKALKVEARKLLVKAGNELFAARKSAFAAGNSELRKEIRDFAKAEDVEPSEEKEEEEDSEKSRIAAEAAAKAAKEAAEKGNQSDSANADGNQDDSSTSTKAKAEEAETQKKALNDALSGIAMLETTVKGLIAAVSGKSRPAPEIVKGDGKITLTKGAAFKAKIDEAESNGDLNTQEVFAAKDILGKLEAVEQGIIEDRFVQERLSRSPQKVQDLFRVAA